MRFVIIASRRTGSSHLVNTLSGHPEIFCHGNIFASGMMAVFWPKGERPPGDTVKRLKADLRSLRSESPEKFLERAYALDHGRPHVGFKIFPGQHDEILEALLDDAAVRKVILFRRNILASYSSTVAARDSGTWGIEKGSDLPPIPKVQFDEDHFLRYWEKFIGWYDHAIERLNARRQTFHLVHYEDINDPALLSAAVNFVGADGSRPIVEVIQRKQQIKLNSNDIPGRFADPGRVLDFLRQRGLMHWAYEGESSLSALAGEPAPKPLAVPARCESLGGEGVRRSTITPG